MGWMYSPRTAQNHRVHRLSFSYVLGRLPRPCEKWFWNFKHVHWQPFLFKTGIYKVRLSQKKILDFIQFSFRVAFYSRLGCNNCNNGGIWHLVQYFTADSWVKDYNGWNILTFKHCKNCKMPSSLTLLSGHYDCHDLRFSIVRNAYKDNTVRLTK